MKDQYLPSLFKTVFIVFLKKVELKALIEVIGDDFNKRELEYKGIITLFIFECHKIKDLYDIFVPDEKAKKKQKE